ncbi:MAG: SoxR reducing system RseC family protein [Lentimicrobiaceae bacterium]|nr:SoxR reducing system RseC family protein [Lentimicrobiaceae bacterium]
MNEPLICHQGIVKKITDSTLFVEIERSSACAACHAKNICISSEKKDEIIPVSVSNPNEFTIGELVQVNMKKSLSTKAVMIAYLFPFIALVAGLFITYYFTKNELLSIGVAFAATALYFLFIKKIDKKLTKQFSFFVSKIEI